MNRNEEYRVLMDALETTPPELEYTVERAEARCDAKRKQRRAWGFSAVGAAACFTGFVLLVNLSMPFAYACGRIPLLRELAQAVTWSPSLSAAVENEYVQPIGQSQTVNGITATIEHVIVDQKQVNIFYTLEGDYDNLSGELPEFSPDQQCSVHNSNFNQPPGSLLQFTMDYGDQDVPEGFTMTFGATTYEAISDRALPAESSVLDEPPREEPDILAEFTFDLEFDPNYTAKGEIIPIGKTFQMDGQAVTVIDAEVYPTHVRVNVQGDPDNSAWLEGLDFYLEDDSERRFEPIRNGISAMGSEQENGTVSYHLESPYFSDSRHLTLFINGATWLDKDMARIRVDLQNSKADRLPEGVELYSVERLGKDWVVQFSAVEEEEMHFYQLFHMSYYDADGNTYHSNSRSTTTSPYFEGSLNDPEVMERLEKDGEGRFFELMILRDYEQDEVWLEPTFSHHTVETTPVAIAIK